MRDFKPVFIFSLPRSGSTLLQKILMTSKQIASVAEPWILLPIVTKNRNLGLSPYGSRGAYQGVSDFISNIGTDKYTSLTANYVKQLYNSLSSSESKYFLDKTPKYYLIIDEIIKMFPNAKFIFLFRNPLSIYASVMKSWKRNKFLIFQSRNDLYFGPSLLAQAYIKYQDVSLKLNYDELVTDPQKTIKTLSQYLDIEMNYNYLSDFHNQNLKGIMGDKVGTKLYSSVSVKSIDKWKDTFNSFFRKIYMKSYIKNFDEHYLNCMELTKSALLSELKTIRVKKIYITDIFDVFFSYVLWKSNIIFSRFFNKDIEFEEFYKS